METTQALYKRRYDMICAPGRLESFLYSLMPRKGMVGAARILKVSISNLPFLLFAIRNVFKPGGAGPGVRLHGGAVDPGPDWPRERTRACAHPHPPPRLGART